MQAVERFEGGEKNREIAAALRVSERSVERWRRQWRERGEVGVLSKGSPGRPRLSDRQIARLERELERGPLVHGWTDQRWTLVRVKALIGRLFQVSYTVEGTWRLLKRHGWSWQQPARRAPQEGIWSLVKRDIGNLAAANLGQLTRAVKHKLKQIQYRPHPVDGCLAGTGLALDG